MVATISARLSKEPDQAYYIPFIGGSTYTFDVGPEHPLREEALQTLSSFRQRCSDLRKRIAEHNSKNLTVASTERIIAYAGQSVISEEIKPDGE